MITNAECKESMKDQTNNKAFNNPLNSELPHKILYNINMHSLNKNIIKSQTHIFTHHMIDDHNSSLLVTSKLKYVSAKQT